MTKNPERPSRKTKPADKPKPAFKLARGKTVARTGSANQAPRSDPVTTMNPNPNEASEHGSDLPQHAVPELTPQVGSESEPPVTLPAAAVEGAATQNNVSLPAGDIASDAAQASAAGFPGEILENTEATSVDAYAVNISAAWHRTVNAVMITAQFCAEADARLTSQQKKELIAKLPFGEETFSKLVGIGNDLRLRQPEIQWRLPPYYTTIYVITTFDEDEFRLAVDLQVIHAEVTRSELEQWHNEHRQEAREEPVVARTAESSAAETDTAAQEPAKNSAAPEPGVQGEALAPTVGAPSPTAPPSPEPILGDAADVTILSPAVVPTGAEDALLDEAAKGKEDRGAERRRQVADQRVELLNLCIQLERERDQREERYVALCREFGREPEPFDPVSPKDAPPTSLAEDLDQLLRAVLLARGFDLTTAEMKAAIQSIVQAALAQQQ
jgi:hypothetical protein